MNDIKTNNELPDPFLLSTEALEDLWANPSGTWLTHQAAREVYRFLGVEERIDIQFRDGGHNHGTVDWSVFLDFCDWRFRNIQPSLDFNACPFPGLKPLFSWNIPDNCPMETSPEE